MVFEIVAAMLDILFCLRYIVTIIVFSTSGGMSGESDCNCTVLLDGPSPFSCDHNCADIYGQSLTIFFVS